MEGGYSRYLDVNAYSKEEYREAFVGLLQDTYMADIEHILLGEDEAAHYGLTIDMVELINYNAQLGSLLIRYPLKLLPIFDDAIRDVQSSAFTDHALRHQLTYKHNVHARIGNLPGLEVTKVRLPTSQDVGRLLALKATVTRTGPVKMLEYKREFVCTKCKSSFFVESDFEQQNVLPKPTVCQGDDEGVPCHGTKFRDMVAENGGTPQYCSDYQDVKIQEQVQRLAMGTISVNLKWEFGDVGIL